MTPNPPTRAAFLRHWAVATLVVCAGPALAQTPYKVIGADGRVTYTDRPPTAATDSRIGPLPSSTAPSVDTVLPLELRQATSRFPVTLYVTGDDCAPCAAGRDRLRRRGVPFSERTVQTPEDASALERLTGAREAPTVTIGGQVLTGFSPSVWDSYLDAAGYPGESQLPVSYRYPRPMPLVARATPTEPAADPPATLAPSLPISAGPIRF